MKRALLVGCFVLVVAFTCHLCFSWMGFTPTDEGFTLAHSRRILDGQIPHRDFIIIRPFVSPLIHVPEVWLGGASALWLSRFVVWFQFACLAAAWTIVSDRLTNRSLSLAAAFSGSLICFAATVHTKHLTPWHTIDGLFFFFVGLAFCTRPKTWSKLAGYFLLGLAPLCKQGFIFMVPGALVLLSDWRSIKYWCAGVLPGLLYVVYLLCVGGIFDAVTQLTSHPEFFATAVLAYCQPRVLLSAAIGFCAAHLIASAAADGFRRWSALIILYVAPLIGTAVSLALGVMISTAFLLFGLCLGIAVYWIVSRQDSPAAKRVMLLALLAAWTASISGGYNSPALGAGALLVAVAITILGQGPHWQRRLVEYSLPVFCALIVAGFVIGRVQHIYRDQSAEHLNHPIEDVMPGGKGIYTNPNTYAFLRDLRRAVEFVERTHRIYAIIPDVGAYWVKSPQANPFPAVWPHGEELKTPPLLNRYLRAIDARRIDTTVIVQKVAADNLASGFAPLPEGGYFEVVRYVRQNLEKVHETDYFALYQ
jgi:hypothetical protein